MYVEVWNSLIVEKHDYLVCPEHKTAEVARSAQKTKSNTYKGRSSQDSNLE